MPDAALSRLINAAVAAQQRGVSPAILTACAEMLEASGATPAAGRGASELESPLRTEHLPPVAGSAVTLDEISADLDKTIRKLLGRRSPAEVVKEVRLWYAQRGLVEPPAKTIEALVAAAQVKREAKRSAALKAWAGKSPEERKAWISKLGREPKSGAKKAKARK